MKTEFLMLIITIAMVGGLDQYEVYGSFNKIDAESDVIQISGLDKTHYLLSEPVTFGISATDLECGKVIYQILNKNNMTKIHESSVSASCGIPPNWGTSFGVFINSNDTRSITINQAGDFQVIAWFEYQNGTKITTEKEFSLRKNMSGASLDTTIYSVLSMIGSPLKQFKSGILLDEIQCKESLILVVKHDGSPACVKPETIPKLIERGWIYQAYKSMLSEDTLRILKENLENTKPEFRDEQWQKEMNDVLQQIEKMNSRPEPERTAPP